MKNKIFVTIELTNSAFKAYLTLNNLEELEMDTERLLEKVVSIYEKQYFKLETHIRRIKDKRSRRVTIKAREIWIIGNEILKLNSDLSMLKVVIDDLYFHLCRDLSVKRKWLEKVVILRKNVSRIEILPEELSWGYFEKGTKRKALQLMN